MDSGSKGGSGSGGGGGHHHHRDGRGKKHHSGNNSGGGNSNRRSGGGSGGGASRSGGASGGGGGQQQQRDGGYDGSGFDDRGGSSRHFDGGDSYSQQGGGSQQGGSRDRHDRRDRHRGHDGPKNVLQRPQQQQQQQQGAGVFGAGGAFPPYGAPPPPPPPAGSASSPGGSSASPTGGGANAANAGAMFGGPVGYAAHQQQQQQMLLHASQQGAGSAALSQQQQYGSGGGVGQQQQRGGGAAAAGAFGAQSQYGLMPPVGSSAFGGGGGRSSTTNSTPNAAASGTAALFAFPSAPSGEGRRTVGGDAIHRSPQQGSVNPGAAAPRALNQPQPQQQPQPPPFTGVSGSGHPYASVGDFTMAPGLRQALSGIAGRLPLGTLDTASAAATTSGAPQPAMTAEDSRQRGLAAISSIVHARCVSYIGYRGAAPFGLTQMKSTKFAHYLKVYNLDKEPRPCGLAPAYRSMCHRTTNRFSDADVFLRRFVGVNQAITEVCDPVAKVLRMFRHPNVVPLHSIAFTTDFADTSDVIMEYQFIKGARSLPEHIVCHQEFSEGVVWSVAAQLVSLVRHFHSLDTPLRTLHLSKLMLCDDLEATTDAQDGTGQAPVPAATGTQRVLFTGLGMLDILDPLPPGGVPQAMRRDFASLAEVLDDMMMASAKIAAQRAMGNSMTPASAQAVTAALNASFSPALSEFVRICREATSIDAICAAIGPRMAAELGNQMGSAEYVRKEALKEVHNGRLMKLLIRLNMVYAYLQNAQDYDPYYTVRLFFQHLFAPIDDHNRPRRDWGLIYHGLNKFDTRSDDLLQLISPDTGTILVVSYADIATAVEAAENDINAVASGQTTAAAAAASVALGGGVGGTGTTGIGSPLGFPSAATAAAVAAATSLPTLGFAAGIPGISLPGLGLNLPALGVTVGAHHAARVHSAPSLQSTVGSTFAYPPTSGR